MKSLKARPIIIATLMFLSSEGFSFFQTGSTTFPSRASKILDPSASAVKDYADSSMGQSRRETFSSFIAIMTVGAGVVSSPAPASAAPDCMKDCVKNCLLIAPQDKQYCTETCTDYCAQPDRTDGLSGSVSAENGEVGILGGSFGQGTVPKGEDKPPSIKLPGLDFSSASGKKLLGY